MARKVCAGKVPSHVPSPTRACIGVSSFTSRNLRDRFRSGNIVIPMVFALPLVFCSRSTRRVEKKHILCRHSTLYMYHHPVYARKVLRHVPSSCQSLVKPSSKSCNSQKNDFFVFWAEVVLSVFLRAQNRALECAFWCSPSCQKNML